MTVVAFLDQQRGAVGNLLAFELAALGVDDGDVAVALQDDEVLVAFGIGDFDRVEVAVVDDAGGAGADFVLRDSRGGRCRRCGTCAS